MYTYEVNILTWYIYTYEVNILTLFSQDDGSTLLHNLFNQMDLNLDGFLSMSEAEEVLKAMDSNGRLEVSVV